MLKKFFTLTLLFFSLSSFGMQDGTISQEIIVLRAEQKRKHTDFQANQLRKKQEEEQSLALAKKLQEDDEIAYLKKRAQEEADAEIAQFCGETVMELEQRLETLDRVDENDIIRLQTDIDRAIGLFHDTFVSNTRMTGLDTSAATQSMLGLKKILKNKKPFSEQISNIDRVCPHADSEKETAQPCSNYQETTPYYEQNEDNQPGPSSPSMYGPDADITKLVQEAINNDNQELMRELLDELPPSTPYNTLREDLKQALALSKRARSYERSATPLSTNTRPTLQETAHVNPDRPTARSSQPLCSSLQNQNHLYLVTDEYDPRLREIVEDAIKNNNHEILHDILSQLTRHTKLIMRIQNALAQQPKTSTSTTVRHRNVQAVQEVPATEAAALVPVQQPAGWFTQHPSLIKIGAATALIGAYFWYKKSH